MGKGLSPLQRTILAIAWENRRAGAAALPLRGISRREAYNHEVLQRYFGWESIAAYGGRRIQFRVNEIGEPAYRSAHASLTERSNVWSAVG
jgi:hypothetical protein